MSIDLVFNGIIVNIFSNKALECHLEVVYGYLKKRITTKFICTEVHFKTFTEIKALKKYLCCMSIFQCCKKMRQ